ncbi:MAG: hypothetical protein IPK26_23850 [Planctomycetes bacterium]|nr:hypothetical protein [Planctomycetota bacterium]
MVGGSGWWAVPVGCVLMLLFVGTVAPPTAATSPKIAPPTERVVVQDASGNRSAPVPLVALTTGAVILEFDRTHIGRRVHLRIWSHDSPRDQPPQLDLRPRVRNDATIPIAGLATGRHHVVWLENGQPIAEAPFTIGADAARVRLAVD